MLALLDSNDPQYYVVEVDYHKRLMRKKGERSILLLVSQPFAKNFE